MVRKFRYDAPLSLSLRRDDKWSARFVLQCNEVYGVPYRYVLAPFCSPTESQKQVDKL